MKIKVTTSNDTKLVSFDDDKSVLESLERNHVDVHYHCRDGFCGACRCKLVCGEIDYTTSPLAFIDDDEFLPCCSVPLGDIEIIVE